MARFSKLFEKQFYYFIGLAGIAACEGRGVRRIGSVFSGLMVLIAMVLLIEWQWQLLREISQTASFIVDWVIFIFFIMTYGTQWLLVKDRWQYIGQNWALPIIIILGIPFIVEYKPLMQPLSALRPLLAIYIIFPSLRTLISFFFDGNLRTTLLGAAVVIVIFGLLVAGVDPSVKTVWDGIWWAVATVATIGYGDVVPSSALGRLLGVILVVLGVAIFVIITANILAYILKKDRNKSNDNKEMTEILDELKAMKKAQKKQEKMLEEMNKKISDHESE